MGVKNPWTIPTFNSQIGKPPKDMNRSTQKTRLPLS